MIITMKKSAPQEEIDRLLQNLESRGLHVTTSIGANYNVFGVIGDTTVLDIDKISASPFVENVQRISAPYKLANRVFHPADTIVDVGGVRIGGSEPIVVMKTLLQNGDRKALEEMFRHSTRRRALFDRPAPPKTMP